MKRHVKATGVRLRSDEAPWWSGVVFFAIFYFADYVKKMRPHRTPRSTKRERIRSMALSNSCDLTSEQTMNESRVDAGTTSGPTIDVTDDAGVQAWAKKLDVTPEQIREAVQAKGDQAAAVEMHLKGTHATTNADQEARVEGRNE